VNRRAWRACAALLCFSGLARAQNATEQGFRTDIANCPEEITNRLPAIVKLEIDVLMRERGSARALPDRIEFKCEDDAARIDVTSGGASRTTTIRFRNLLPEHRARALALAAAELVHAMSSPVSTVIGSILGMPRRFRGMRSCPIFSTMMSAVKFPPSNWLIAPQ